MLTEANRREYGPLAREQGKLSDKVRFVTRIEVYPKGKTLSEALSDFLFTVYEKDRYQLSCIDAGPPCAVVLVDLDGDGSDEAVVVHGYSTNVYARQANLWAKVGQLQSYAGYRSRDELRQALMEGRVQVIPLPKLRGIEIGTTRYTFVPASCEPQQPDCRESGTR